MRYRAPAFLLALALSTAPAGAAMTDAWDRVVRAHMRAGGVDYDALRGDRADLDAYLASLAEAVLDGRSVPERTAFWINAYNAVVIHFVLERYPGIASVRDVDGFFDELRFPVAGADRTLDEIEAAALEPGDPRVHFAVVCASTSCPDLRAEAYRAERLEEQLAEQTRRFLADPGKGLRWEEGDDEIHLSSIFKWYAGDFTGGSTVVSFFFRGGVLEWVAGHVPEPLRRRIEREEPDVAYLDYDWSLNDR